MKKFISILLAVLMVMTFASAMNVFADTQTADLTGHVYTAYQIFSGEQAEDSAELGNIVWGSGIDGENFLKELKETDAFGDNNPFAACNTARDVAEAMMNWADKSANANVFAAIAKKYVTTGQSVENGVSTLDAGYYLVVDTTNVAPGAVKNLALLQLTKKGTFEIKSKIEVPEVEKKLSDDNEGLICTNTAAGHKHTVACYKWSDANQVSIGDTVHFKLDSTVPASATYYDYYYFIIGDKLSEGLTYTANSLKVTINGEAATEGVDYTVVYGADNHVIEVALIDAKAHADEDVLVLYDAVLNSDAEVGTTGNPNEVVVIYSSNPNEDYKDYKDPEKPGFPEKPNTPGTPEDPENPNYPGAEEYTAPLGETPKDYTVTYTSEVKLIKVDQNLKALSGAQFTLTGDGMDIVLTKKEVFHKAVAGETGAYYALKDGTFTKSAPIMNDYMTAAPETANAGYVVAASGYTGEDAVTVGGVKYRPYNPDADAGKDLYILVRANVDNYVVENGEINRAYVKEVQLVSTSEPYPEKVVASVDEKGEIIFSGLRAGEYTITETVTPAGYNTADPITFKTDCTLPASTPTGSETCTWKKAVGDKSGIVYNADEDYFELTIINKRGPVLPETGGIGTPIFYAIGAILVVAAAILLITKKRVKAEER